MVGSKMAFAVIGAAYGDEGKGLMTDRLVWQYRSEMVVRSNGGAQAGHTVTTPDGRRHVFSHIGSGAFAGARTHLSRYFVAHPMFFLGEREKVAALGGETRVSIDPRAIVTTPYDILINQIVEEARGSARHGSCGMGFGETIERNIAPDAAITVADLAGNRLGLVSRLERIRRDWVETRLGKLGIPEMPEGFKGVLKDDGVFRRFLSDCDAFLESVSVMDDADIPDGAVFEGAQGLMLDQDYGAFPHVTRSNTGILNMSLIAAEAGIDLIEATYATRAYTTRHGAGPLAHEGDDMSYADIVDPTNIHNDWQGTIRSAPLDLDILAAAVSHDLGRAIDTKVESSLAVSCLDQVRSGVAVYASGRKELVSGDDTSTLIAGVLGKATKFQSYGPTHADVRQVSS
jgi:adenylosuccinate synthase|nr:adenylosuccinate synthetase [Neorhizobium tomejilense]